MKVLVTGADGFVGQHLVRILLQGGHSVVAGCRPGTRAPSEWDETVEVVKLEVCDTASVRAALQTGAEGIVHLAAVSYSQDAKRDPDEAWNTNVGGTKTLLDNVRARGENQLVLVTSTADIYAEATRPVAETDQTRALSVYAATKLGAEAAAAHAAASGVRVIIVRPFPATGPGQTNRLLPNWFSALRAGKTEIEGEPEIIRDYVDVRDTAAGFVAILARGHPGEVYNIATGREIRFGDLFRSLVSALGVNARLIPPANPRRESRYLVGDSRKLREHTGWQPTIPLDQTIADMISHAEAH